MKLTITEALAEIRLIQKRLATKRKYLLENVVRHSALRDPHESSGGQEATARQTKQGILDLERRHLRIRAAIQRSNLDTMLTVSPLADVDGEVAVEETRSVADWLVWRREIAAGQMKLERDIVSVVTKNQEQLSALAKQATSETFRGGDLVVNVNVHDAEQRADAIQRLLGSLDGALTKHNSITQIEV